MAYVDGYSWDVFLSYTWSDNDLPGDRAKWISTFRDNLAKEIEGLLGDPVAIQFDKRDFKLNKKIPASVVANLRSSVLLVAITSPGYVNSSWCQFEVEEFQKLYPQDRMFVAELLPLRGKPYPEPLRDQPPAIFWTENKETKSILSVTPRTRQYQLQLNKLANDIVNALLEVIEGAPPPPPGPARAVYIAYAADDVDDKRVKLKTYLESAHRGLRVLPEPFIRPGTTERYLEAVKAGLDEAAVYVQLLGQSPAQALEDLEAGDTYHQHAEAVKRPKLERYFWHPDTVQPSSVEDKKYRTLLEGGNVRAGEFADLNKTIAEVIGRPPAPPPSPPTGKPVIVISANRADETYANDIFDACVRKDFNVSRASLARAKQLRERFAAADTVTFIYARADERWLDTQHDIFMRARAEHAAPLGRVPIIVCVGPPVEPGKRLPFHTQGMREVDVRDCWRVEPFERVLDDLGTP